MTMSPGARKLCRISFRIVRNEALGSPQRDYHLPNRPFSSPFGLVGSGEGSGFGLCGGGEGLSLSSPRISGTLLFAGFGLNRGFSFRGGVVVCISSCLFSG